MESRHFHGPKSVMQVFYFNFSVPTSKVLIRGKIVDVSSITINAFYKLPDIAEDGCTTMLHNPDFLEVSQVLTGADIGLLTNLRKLLRSQLIAKSKIQ